MVEKHRSHLDNDVRHAVADGGRIAGVALPHALCKFHVRLRGRDQGAEGVAPRQAATAAQQAKSAAVR